MLALICRAFASAQVCVHIRLRERAAIDRLAESKESDLVDVLIPAHLEPPRTIAIAVICGMIGKGKCTSPAKLHELERAQINRHDCKRTDTEDGYRDLVCSHLCRYLTLR